MNNRNQKGKFKPGCSGNPKGRPKSAEADELRKALARAAKKKGKKLLDHCIERAYESDAMAIAILRKILPDLTHLDNNLPGNIEVTIIDSYKIDKD